MSDTPFPLTMTIRAAGAQGGIAPAVERLLEIFHAELASVAFPGVDTGVLDAAAAVVSNATDAVARASAALDTARAALAAAQDELLAKGQRALAYARVYAEDQPALLEELDGISLPRAARAAPAEVAAAPSQVAPRRRGRPRTSGAPASLFAPAPDGEVEAIATAS